MNKKRLIVSGSIILGLIIIVTLLITFMSGRGEIAVIENESYYDTFHITDGKVTITCQLTLRNKTDDTKRFHLYALFPEDLENELLMNEKLYALDDALNTRVFELAPGERQTLEVVFVGDSAGGTLKAKQRLPEIGIDILF